MAVVLERFAEQARTVVADTMATAQAQGIAEVRAEHLLLSLTRVADGATAAALTENHLDEALVARVVRDPEQLVDDEDRAALGALGIDVDELMARLEEGLGPDALAPVPSNGVRRPRFTKEAKKALEMAVRTTTGRHARTITTDDLLVGIVRAGSPGVASVLTAAGTTEAAVIASVTRLRGAA
ncbi:MAG: Clp protease N-terminal domain-containing protein [Candidatus Nanopelagicales bacterium]